MISRCADRNPCHVGTCRGHLGAGLFQHQLRYRAQFAPRLVQFQRFLVGGQRRLCDTQLLAVGGQGQPQIGDFGHQRQLRAALRFLGRQILLQRSLAEVAHAPEQIQFECGDTQTHAVGFRFQRRIVGPDALHLRVDADAWETVGALDAVLGAGAIHVQNRHAQIAVVVQRQPEHFLQTWVGEEIAPADIRQRCRGALACNPGAGRQWPFGRDHRVRVGDAAARSGGGTTGDEHHGHGQVFRYLFMAGIVLASLPGAGCG